MMDIDGESTDVHVASLSDLCRLCGDVDNECVELFGDTGIEEELVAKIENAVRITVSEDDTLPKGICTACREKLLGYSAFYQHCHETQEKLQDFFSIQSAVWQCDDTSQLVSAEEEKDADDYADEEELVYYEQEGYMEEDDANTVAVHPSRESESEDVDQNGTLAPVEGADHLENETEVNVHPSLTASVQDGRVPFSHQESKLVESQEMKNIAKDTAIPKESSGMDMNRAGVGSGDLSDAGKELLAKMKSCVVVLTDCVGKDRNERTKDKGTVNCDTGKQVTLTDIVTFAYHDSSGNTFTIDVASRQLIDNGVKLVEDLGGGRKEIKLEDFPKGLTVEQKKIFKNSTLEIPDEVVEAKLSELKEKYKKKEKKAVERVTIPFLVLGDGRLIKVDDVEKDLPMDLIPNPPVVLLYTSEAGNIPPIISFDEECIADKEREVERGAQGDEMPSTCLSSLPCGLQLEHLPPCTNLSYPKSSLTPDKVLDETLEKLVCTQSKQTNLLLPRIIPSLMSRQPATKYFMLRREYRSKEKRYRKTITKEMGKKAYTPTPECREVEDYMESVPGESSSTKCKACGKVYTKKMQCNYHIRSEHLRILPFSCDMCERKFATNYLLKRHLDVVHTRLPDFICCFCGEKLRSMDTLRAHELAHTTPTAPFICEFCGRGFYRKPNYDRHKIERHAEKTLVCDTCGDAFANIRKLKEHRETHGSGYQCKHCGKKYLRQSTLRMHLHRHEKKHLRTCNLCGKIFPSFNAAQNHQHISCKKKVPFGFGESEMTQESSEGKEQEQDCDNVTEMIETGVGQKVIVEQTIPDSAPIVEVVSVSGDFKEYIIVDVNSQQDLEASEVLVHLSS